MSGDEAKEYGLVDQVIVHRTLTQAGIILAPTGRRGYASRCPVPI